jgi:hypothetical protein
MEAVELTDRYRECAASAAERELLWALVTSHTEAARVKLEEWLSQHEDGVEDRVEDKVIVYGARAGR